MSVSGYATQELLQRERETGRWRFWNLEFKEMDDDPSDRVVAPHYRYILSFTANDPAPLVPGTSIPFIENAFSYPVA